MKYRKKPVVVDAVQFTGRNHAEVIEFCPGAQISYDGNVERIIDVTLITLEGVMKVSPRDYIICGVQGEFYPCKPDIFMATYEPVAE